MDALSLKFIQFMYCLLQTKSLIPFKGIKVFHFSGKVTQF